MVEGLMHFSKNMLLNLKGTAFWSTNMIESQWSSGDITLLNHWYLFGHIARGWLSESFAGGNGKTCGRIEKTKRTPLNTLELKREERPCATEYCLHSDLRKAQNRTGWRRLEATTTFWHRICQWWWWRWWYLRQQTSFKRLEKNLSTIININFFYWFPL